MLLENVAYDSNVEKRRFNPTAIARNEIKHQENRKNKLDQRNNEEQIQDHNKEQK